MNFVDSSVNYVGLCPSNDEDEILKHIERAGRLCYKSEGKIDHDNGSHIKFYKMLVKNGHLSAIEHSNIVVSITFFNNFDAEYVMKQFATVCFYSMSYFRLLLIPEDDKSKLTKLIISANIRAWLDFMKIGSNFVFYEFLYNFFVDNLPTVFFSLVDTNNKENLKKHLEAKIVQFPFLLESYFNIELVKSCDLETYSTMFDNADIPIYTFIVTTDRGITHEIVRHRTLSYSQESTRYCNYSGGVSFINSLGTNDALLLKDLEDFCRISEKFYNNLLSSGVKPQFARNVLPHCLKTEIAISGRYSAWKHFVSLRSGSGAHPDIRKIANEIKNFLF